ncbi:hypothetical protein [Nostoc linckia]|uniref:Uncharacterized protein n=1 Tax=Nostoc linckia z8 TaxID=1628746 RepID=A0A9Q6EHE7_NOSLI|nr:hypothetical protein [Nostoc linckia]PHJ82006.1 hypothetical protein VF07_29395 [Nostoc linckia z6]PHJ94043.1 hypothetical protein VF08_34505 [Nostoc linckia z8]
MKQPDDKNGNPVPILGWQTPQPLVVDGTARATTNTIGSQAFWIYTTIPAHIALGDAPLADTDDFPIPAGVPLVFPCESTQKISIIRLEGSTDSGKAWISGVK